MKTAIVYFSRSGVTRAAAEYLAQRLGTTAGELVPAEPYPAEYRAVVARAMEEIRAHALPQLDGMPDVADCGLVLCGSPTWCGTFAAPLATFLANAPLDGKRVALFCTSGGSGLANMPRDAAALAPGAIFEKPLALRSGSDTEALDRWLEELGLTPDA